MRNIDSKIFDFNDLKEFLSKKKNKKVVFTNGCFDILHRGHVSYLQNARGLGDFLIVGVNSDRSVSRLKGPTRPIQNEDDRLFILAGLECVDAVVLFKEDTPIHLIEHLLPNILVKGGDYVIEEIVGYEVVTKNGGLVTTLPFVEGKSTSNIVKKMK
jgi:D-beta-D-heptose 7-phosphate kinase/D-beta-D-heptose 1-phosphate adenosyltransferase